MSADELRGVSPHNAPSDVFGKARRSWKAKHVPTYIPRKTPFSITFIGFIGNVLIAVGILAMVFGGLTFYQGEGFRAGMVACSGFVTVIAGALLVAHVHVAKAQLRTADMLAHKLSHGE
jgi:hypothetical protein